MGVLSLWISRLLNKFPVVTFSNPESDLTSMKTSQRDMKNFRNINNTRCPKTIWQTWKNLKKWMSFSWKKFFFCRLLWKVWSFVILQSVPNISSVFSKYSRKAVSHIFPYILKPTSGYISNCWCYSMLQLGQTRAWSLKNVVFGKTSKTEVKKSKVRGASW